MESNKIESEQLYIPHVILNKSIGNSAEAWKAWDCEQEKILYLQYIKELEGEGPTISEALLDKYRKAFYGKPPYDDPAIYGELYQLLRTNILAERYYKHDSPALGYARIGFLAYTGRLPAQNPMLINFAEEESGYTNELDERIIESISEYIREERKADDYFVRKHCQIQHTTALGTNVGLSTFSSDSIWVTTTRSHNGRVSRRKGKIIRHFVAFSALRPVSGGRYYRGYWFHTSEIAGVYWVTPKKLVIMAATGTGKRCVKKMEIPLNVKEENEGSRKAVDRRVVREYIKRNPNLNGIFTRMNPDLETPKAPYIPKENKLSMKLMPDVKLSKTDNPEKRIKSTIRKMQIDISEYFVLELTKYMLRHPHSQYFETVLLQIDQEHRYRGNRLRKFIRLIMPVYSNISNDDKTIVINVLNHVSDYPGIYGLSYEYITKEMSKAGIRMDEVTCRQCSLLGSL